MAKTMTVQVRETPVRARPSHMAPVRANLKYGDRVDVVEEKEGWRRLAAPEGWVHVSALTRKDLDLQAGDRDVDAFANSDEVALAGKGFNEEIEADYRDKKQLDYRWVDAMEDLVSSPDELCAFLAEGKLRAAEECAS